MRRLSSREGTTAHGRHKVLSDVESLDYDIDASSIFEQDLQRQSAQARNCQMNQRWAVCGAIGCTTGAVAFLIDVLTLTILKGKYQLAASVARNMPASDPGAGPFFAVLLSHAGLSVLFVAISSALVVFIEPVAGAEPSTLGPCTAPQTSLPDPATKGCPERRRARARAPAQVAPASPR